MPRKCLYFKVFWGIFILISSYARMDKNGQKRLFLRYLIGTNVGTKTAGKERGMPPLFLLAYFVRRRFAEEVLVFLRDVVSGLARFLDIAVIMPARKCICGHNR